MINGKEARNNMVIKVYDTEGLWLFDYTSEFSPRVGEYVWFKGKFYLVKTVVAVVESHPREQTFFNVYVKIKKGIT